VEAASRRLFQNQPAAGRRRHLYLDRFKLAGVIATWWTDTLPDFKTLLENGFPGVLDGWVDAIADALEDTKPPARLSIRSAISWFAVPWPIISTASPRQGRHRPAQG